MPPLRPRRLRVYDGTTLLGELEPFNPRGAISAQGVPDWKKINDTLNLELPASWTNTAALCFEVEVNPTHVVSETD